MINTDRIVPVTATDLISLYGLIARVYASAEEYDLVAIDAVDTEGNFELTEALAEATIGIASEPVATFDFGEDVTAATVFFVPAYDYAGFTIDGSAATMGGSSVDVDADGRTLYTATLSSGAVTVTKFGF